MTDYTWGVIDAAPPGEGNEASINIELMEKLEPHIGINRAFKLRTPVFHVGDLLLLDANGREVSYPGRKPSKWDVSCRHFAYEDRDAAIACAKEVSQ